MKNTWVELDLGVLRENIRALRKALEGRCETVFVVKADAYGHGMALVAPAAHEAGIEWFAVAHLDEAVALRDLLPGVRILILGAVDARDVRTLAAKRLIPLVVGEDHARSLCAAWEAGAKTDGPLHCHAKIDTGMGRFGFRWETAADILVRLAASPGLRLDGICSHFASSSSPDQTVARTQAKRFFGVVEECAKRGLTLPFRHISNSGATLRHPDWDLEAIRSGILLYGYRGGAAAALPGTAAAAAPDAARRVSTRPFLAWKTRVVNVKRVPGGVPISYDGTYVTSGETYIGTLNVGYSDGYGRRLGNRAQVIVRGRRRPVAGRVTMNFMAVDLGPAGDVCQGDEVVLIGRQGGEAVWADEVAGWAETICYEVLTSIRTGDRRVVGA